MNDMTIQSSMSILSPPSGDALGRYLAAVERALGVRSDAELATLMGVTPAAIANWKRRGGIPEEHQAWFLESLIPKIARAWDDLPQASRTARAAVMAFIVITSGNPLAADRIRMTENANALGGLLALAELLASLYDISPRSLNSDIVSKLVDQLEKLMPQFRIGVGLPTA